MLSSDVSLHIGFLAKWALAEGTDKGLESCVASEVVPNVAALVELLVAASYLALVHSIKLVSVRVEDLLDFIPVLGYTIECRFIWYFSGRSIFLGRICSRVTIDCDK